MNDVECETGNKCYQSICQAYWEQQPFTASGTLSDWNIQKVAYGADNRRVVADPVNENKQVLRVFFPKGSMNPGNKPVGGTGVSV